MTLVIENQEVPLRTDGDGGFRVGQSRVRLDTVIFAFNEGYTVEDIISQYPTLNLADVYAVIAYYLNNRAIVDDYLRQREAEAEELWREIEAKPEYQLFRQRILARQKDNYVLV